MANILVPAHNGSDDTAAMTDFLQAVAAGEPGYLSAGKYQLSSNIAITVSKNTSFALFGSGMDTAVFEWEAGGGLTITLQDPNSSVHIHDVTFATGAQNTGTGLTLVQADANISAPGYTAPSELVNVGFRDIAGWNPSTNYWAIALSVQGVSCVTYQNVNATGTTGASYATGGNGLSICGSAGAPSVVHDLNSCAFNELDDGFVYGNYVQGVTMNACNFTGCETSINVPAGSSGNIDQLAVANSQFNDNSNAIAIISSLNLQLTNNLIYVPADGNGLAIVPASGQNNIVGNQFTGMGTKQGGGVVIAGATAGTIITGNTFANLGVGVALAPGSTNVNLQANAYNGNATPYTNAGTGNTLGGGSI
jgi:nitrous oxidase accessory protein NosD